ncbi:MAG: M23 family metallopeptidase [Bdellovibrionales bacterium]|nr:M23 family metallopeptidase [Bdellovibrionales bacterium]
MNKIFVLLSLVLPVSAQAENFEAAFQTWNGNFFRAVNGGGGRLDAQPTQLGQDEKFTLVDENGEFLNHGDSIFLRAKSENYVVAEGGGGRELNANRQAGSVWERFKIFRVSGTGKIRDRDWVYLQPMNIKHYVSAENGGGSTVHSKPTFVGDFEKFKIRLLGRPVLNKLSAPMQSPKAFMMPIGVDHDRSQGSWDADCKNFYDRPFPGCYDQHEGTDFMLLGHRKAVDKGFDVIAAAAGTVVKVDDGFTDRCYFDPRAPDNITCPGTDREDANYVVVRQDDGQYAFYFHLKKWSVAVVKDQRVECGSLIGQVASSGRSSAPHLHFELRGAMSASDEAALAGNFDYVEVRNRTAMVDPYEPDLWIAQSSLIPKKFCNVNNPGSCFEEKTKLFCDSGAYWTACSILQGPLSGTCVKFRRPPATGCEKTCNDVCRRVTERNPVACN